MQILDVFGLLKDELNPIKLEFYITYAYTIMWV